VGTIQDYAIHPFQLPPPGAPRPPLGFVVWAGKWPQPGGLGTPVNLTYGFVNYGPAGVLDEGDVRVIIEDALGLWAAVAPLHFTEAEDTGLAFNHPDADVPDIRIRFEPDDGPNGHLGTTYPPPQPGEPEWWTGWGDMAFDSAENWVDGTGGYDLNEVAAHELGHALGLRHETSVTCLMNPNYKGAAWTGGLYTDDINGIQSLYGSGSGGVNPLGPPICWQATASMPDGTVWRDSGSGSCPAVIRVPRGATDIVVTDDGRHVSPRIVEG